MKKKYLIPLIILIVLIGIRIYLPIFAENYINKTLANLDGYTGSVDDVDMFILGGSFGIDDIEFYVRGTDSTAAPQDKDTIKFQPALARIEELSLQVNLFALIGGKIDASAEIINPVLHYNAALQIGDTTETDPIQWPDVLRNLLPMEIDEFKVSNATLTYVDQKANPPLDYTVKDFNFSLRDFTNRPGEDDDYEKTSYELSATIPGSGRLQIDGELEPMSEMPGIIMNFNLSDFNIAELQPFLAGSPIKMNKGVLSVNFNLNAQLNPDSLLDGSEGNLNLNMALNNPDLTFNPELESETTTAAIDTVDTEEIAWPEHFRRFITTRVSEVAVNNGKITYVNQSLDPNMAVYAQNIDFSLKNLSNRPLNEDSLDTNYQLSAILEGGGTFNLEGKVNALKEIPNVDADLTIENMDLTSYNDFFRSQAWLDFERAKFSLYSEMALVDSSLEGYIKPVLDSLKVYDWDDGEDSGFFNQVYQGAVGAVSEIFENPEEDILGTRLPISGTVSNQKADVWTAVWELLENAFLNPLIEAVEGYITVQGDDIIVSRESGD